jgi:hypothetical protein
VATAAAAGQGAVGAAGDVVQVVHAVAATATRQLLSPKPTKPWPFIARAFVLSRCLTQQNVPGYFLFLASCFLPFFSSAEEKTVENAGSFFASIHADLRVIPTLRTSFLLASETGMCETGKTLDQTPTSDPLLLTIPSGWTWFWKLCTAQTPRGCC